MKARDIKELEDIGSILSCLSGRISQASFSFTKRTREALRMIELDCMGHASFISRVTMLARHKQGLKRGKK